MAASHARGALTKAVVGALLWWLAGGVSAWGQAILPEGFYETQVRNISASTAMALGPDGWIFVCEQRGKLRLIRDGVLQPTAFLQLTVQAFQERGLDGVQFDPGFATNRFFYVYYTALQPTLHNRLSRFTAAETNAVPGSEVVLLELPTLGESGWHNGGSIAFGPDGKLYLGVGDNNIPGHAQSLDTVLGKILRLNPDGSIPADNPFYSAATGANRAIWALGFRNPYTLSFQPGTGRLFANDVGYDKWEEINDVVRGGNYGWPIYEGASNDPNFLAPFYTYPHPPEASSAITGGAFYNPATALFPAEFVGKYFFVDAFLQFINVLDLNTRAVTRFATFPTFSTADPDVGPLYLTVGPEGSLYYLARESHTVNRIRFGATQVPRVGVQPGDQRVVVGDPVRFRITAYGAQPLAYQWEFRAADDFVFYPIPGATQPVYEIPAAGAGDDNRVFHCVVSNPLGTTFSRGALLRALLDTPPMPFINTPAEGTTYRAGDRISFGGQGDDFEEGRLTVNQLTWRIEFRHHDHAHPFVPDTRGIGGGEFVIPTTGETSQDVWYRIFLTATDSPGISRTVFRDVLPRKASVTLATIPAGLQVRLDGTPVTAPSTFVGVAGILRTLEAPRQTFAGVEYEFDSWSQGGTAGQNISTPDADTTFTARFRVATPEIDAAEFVAQSVTNQMHAGSFYPVSVTLRNTGNTTWYTLANYFLASQNPPDSPTWGLNRVELPAPVPPGGSATFNFTVTAPATPGDYDMQWQMVRDGFYFFGGLTPNVPVHVGDVANNARFISQSVPSVMIVGQPYEIAITLRNSGAVAWTTNEFYRLSSQNPPDTDVWGLSRVELPGTVNPGENVTFRFVVTASFDPGANEFQWRMIQDGIGYFGEFTGNQTVQISAGPEVRRAPTAQTVKAGNPVTFTVTAVGLEPLTYHWNRNDTPIPGATAANHTLAAARVADDGARFSCTVANPATSVTSRAARLTVIPPPVPVVTSVSPARGAVQITANAKILATFSLPMSAASINSNSFTLLKSGSPTPVPARVTYDPATRRATLQPSGGLDPAGARYSVQLRGGRGGVESLENAVLAAEVTWTFQTADTVPPRVLTHSPTAGEPVSETPLVTLTLSEPLNANTITAGTLTLAEARKDRAVPAGVSYNPATRTLVLVPTKKLKHKKTYFVTLAGGPAGLADRAGNRLAADFVFSFTVTGKH